MTIILFLIDSSASMAQRNYQGMSALDTARATVEHFLKQRARDAGARGDRYMLMSFEEFPMNVKAGWREGQAIFHERLRALRPKGTTSFGAALGSAFRFVNVNRMQAAIDNYGHGRLPFQLDPVIIISITDGRCLNCPSSGVASEIKFAKPSTIGNELTEEPFRWEQRLFSLVLRMGGETCNVTVTPGMALPSDFSPVDAMCNATGGRSFSVTSHNMLPMCIDAILQRMQQPGVFVQFEKFGLDPPPPMPDRVNGTIENGTSKKNGEVVKKTEENWRSLLTTVFSRTSNRSYVGHWPFPEAFWPDKSMMSLPARKAHPVLMFRCDSSEPMVCQEFPFDRYELDASPLTRFILDRKQPNVCWQVFVASSSMPGSQPAPFGYLKAATNLQSVNLFVMPYNYPVLLPLLEDLKQDSRLRTSQTWRNRLEKYLFTVPYYYIAPLKKAFAHMNVTSPIMEVDQAPQYSYNIIAYLAKMKATAKDEFDANCTAVASALHLSAPPPVPMMTVPRRVSNRNERTQASTNNQTQHSTADVGFQGYQIQSGGPNMRLMPSMKFRNPFEIPRSQLIEQVERMRVNLAMHVRESRVSTLAGGRPGTSIRLHHAEDLHSVPLQEMGNYQEYLKGYEALGRGPLREVEPRPIRASAFGNPFKLDKRSMTVDEVGDGNLLGGNKGGAQRKRFNSNNLTATSEGNRPPRRKPGPLPFNSSSHWRKRRRDWLMSSSSSVASSSSDFDSVTSFDDDTASTAASMNIESNALTSPTDRGSLVNGHAREKRVLERTGSGSSLCSAPKRPCLNKHSFLLDPFQLNVKKRSVGSFVRSTFSEKKTIRMVIEEVWELCLADRKRCIQHALREAIRFKRTELADTIKSRLTEMSVPPTTPT